MKLIIASRSHGRNFKTGVQHYNLTISEVGLFTHLFGQAYHWYDMRFPMHLPGWKRFEKWLARHGADHRAQGLVAPDFEGKTRLRDRLYGWTVGQDFRCYHWNHKKPNHLVTLDLTKEQWDAIKRDARF